MAEGVVLVRRFGRQIEGVNADAGRHDVHYGLRGIGEYGHRTREEVGRILDNQKREPQDHDDLLELVVLIGGRCHEASVLLRQYRLIGLEYPNSILFVLMTRPVESVRLGLG